EAAEPSPLRARGRVPGVGRRRDDHRDRFASRRRHECALLALEPRGPDRVERGPPFTVPGTGAPPFPPPPVGGGGGGGVGPPSSPPNLGGRRGPGGAEAASPGIRKNRRSSQCLRCVTSPCPRRTPRALPSTTRRCSRCTRCAAAPAARCTSRMVS